MVKVLIAHGSKHRTTAAIAQALGQQMQADGLDVDVRPASRSLHPDAYDVVVVGGALYRNRWHHDASMFVRRNKAALRQRPTYLFSSGPLGKVFSGHNPPPVPEVGLLATRVHARGHITFNGALPADAEGFMDRKVAAVAAGDYRDREEEKAWAHHIAEDVVQGEGVTTDPHGELPVG